jgi:hypothetical protein
MAWQFDRPQEGEGVVQAFRRAGNSDASATFRLRGLEPDAVYVLTNLDDRLAVLVDAFYFAVRNQARIVKLRSILEIRILALLNDC